jgi:hypothetical protein
MEGASSYNNLIRRLYRGAYSYLKDAIKDAFGEVSAKEASKFFEKLIQEDIIGNDMGSIYDKALDFELYKTRFENFKSLPLKVGNAKVNLELAAAVDTRVARRKSKNGYYPIKIEFAGRFYIENLSNILTTLPGFKKLLHEILGVKYPEIKDIVKKFPEAVYGDITKNFEEGHERATVAQLFRVDVSFEENGQVSDIIANDIDFSYEENLWRVSILGNEGVDEPDVVRRIRNKVNDLKLGSVSSQKEVDRWLDAAFGAFLALVGESIELVAVEIISLLQKSGNRYLGKEGWHEKLF